MMLFDAFLTRYCTKHPGGPVTAATCLTLAGKQVAGVATCIFKVTVMTVSNWG